MFGEILTLAELAKVGAAGVLVASFLFLLYFLAIRLESAMYQVSLSLNATTSTLLGLWDSLIAHDLTVTGLNPSAGADFDERTNKAYLKYLEMHSAIQSCQSLLERLHEAQMKPKRFFFMGG